MKLSNSKKQGRKEENIIDLKNQFVKGIAEGMVFEDTKMLWMKIKLLESGEPSKRYYNKDIAGMKRISQ